MSAAGAAVMIAVNVVFVPRIGYWACAWGGFAGYGTAMLLSYFIGRRHYPVRYDFKSIGLSIILAAVLLALSQLPSWLGAAWPLWAVLCFNTLLLGAYLLMTVYIIKKRK